MNLLKTFNYKYIFNKIREYLEAAASVYKLISLVKISPKKSFFLKTLKISRAKVKRFTRLKIVSNEAKISGLAGIRHYQIQKMLTPQPLSV